MLGAGVGATVADATSDGVPYGLLALACAVTLTGLTAIGRRRAAALCEPVA